MSGHIKWTDARNPRMDWAEIASVAPHQVELTRFWVQGYILALEDVIKDLEIQRDEYLNDPDAQRALEMTMGEVQGTLLSARRTLDSIDKVGIGNDEV